MKTAIDDQTLTRDERNQKKNSSVKKFLMDTKIGTLLISFKNASDNLCSTLDAIQAKRPYPKRVLQQYLKEWHMNYTKLMAIFWNSRYCEFESANILELVDVLKYQEKTISNYGMSDVRLGNSYNEIMATFCVRSFGKYMPIIINLITILRTKLIQGQKRGKIDYVWMESSSTELFK